MTGFAGLLMIAGGTLLVFSRIVHDVPRLVLSGGAVVCMWSAIAVLMGGA